MEGWHDTDLILPQIAFFPDKPSAAPAGPGRAELPPVRRWCRGRAACSELPPLVGATRARRGSSGGGDGGGVGISCSASAQSGNDCCLGAQEKRVYPAR